MARVITLLMVLLLAGSALELPAWFGADDECEPGCPDAAAGRRCPPVCPSCGCNSHSSPTIATYELELVAPVPSTRAISFTRVFLAPPSPEPFEILHVPRLRLT